MDPSINGDGVTIYSIFIFKFIIIEYIAYLSLLVLNSILGLTSNSLYNYGVDMENDAVISFQYVGVFVLTILR